MIANPLILLNENYQERGQRTRDEDHELESIYTDIRWIEDRGRGWRKGRIEICGAMKNSC
jgi:hypothetical protein